MPVLVLTLILTAGCAGSEEPEPGDSPEVEQEVSAVLVRTLPIEPESVTESLSLPGDLEARRRAVLAAEVPGAVESVRADEGEAVSSGRLLATVDTRSLEQAVAEAEAFQRQAAAQLDRARKLFERRSITQKDLLDAITNADVAEARLASTRLDRSKSRIAAPWSGRIATRHVEVGDYVVPGQATFELVDTRRLKVRAPVPASQVPYLQVGTPVTIRVSGFTGQNFEGEIVRLATELDPDSRTLDLEAEIDNADGSLRPGMLAQVQVPLRTLDEALIVPLAAIIDFESGKVLYVVEDDSADGSSGDLVARLRQVELGSILGDRVVIASGLSAGDRVIVAGQQQVVDGQVVEETEDRSASRAGGQLIDDSSTGDQGVG